MCRIVVSHDAKTPKNAHNLQFCLAGAAFSDCSYLFADMIRRHTHNLSLSRDDRSANGHRRTQHTASFVGVAHGGQ